MDVKVLLVWIGLPTERTIATRFSGLDWAVWHTEVALLMLLFLMPLPAITCFYERGCLADCAPMRMRLTARGGQRGLSSRFKLFSRGTR